MGPTAGPAPGGSTHRHGLSLFAQHFALEHPNLDAEHAVGRAGHLGGVVDVGTQGVQGHPTLAGPFRPGDLSTVQATGDLDLQTQNAGTLSALHSHADGAAEGHTLLQLLGDVLGKEEGITVDAFDLDNIDPHLTTGVADGLLNAGAKLRSGIQKTIGDSSRQVRINVVEVERVDGDAFLLAEYIAQQLEKRVAFRRTIRMAVQRAQRAGVLGLKIQVSGRLNGAEIARTEWTREGRVPLHTLRADIDYATKVASTTYGVLGIKVWVFKGEVLSEQAQPMPVGAAPRRRASRRPQQFEDRSNEG